MRYTLGRAFFALALVSISVLMPGGARAGYDKNYVGEMKEHRAVFEDTLIHLAREYNLGFVEMRAANPTLDPWIPGAGAKVILPMRHLLPDAPREGIVINLPEMRLYAYVNGDDAPYTFPIGIGREGLGTPIGTTKVVRKVEGPVWRPTPRMRKEDPKLPEAVYPGPENPMGTHALYLGWPQYAMHGTNKPYGIGRRVSSGCIRLYPESITQLYKLIPVGTPVNVINEPIKVAWIGDELFLEAHPNVEQAMKMEEMAEVTHEKLTAEEIARIRQVAGDSYEFLNWPRIRRAVRDRNGYPVRIARRDASDAVSPVVSERVDVVPVKQGDAAASSAGDYDQEVEVIDLKEQNRRSVQEAKTVKVKPNVSVVPPKKPVNSASGEHVSKNETSHSWRDDHSSSGDRGAYILNR